MELNVAHLNCGLVSCDALYIVLSLTAVETWVVEDSLVRASLLPAQTLALLQVISVKRAP